MMNNSSHDQDDEFEAIDLPEDSQQETCEGFNVIPQSNSLILPAKKGYIKTFTDGFKVTVTNLYYKFQENTHRVQDLKIHGGNCFFLGTTIKSTKELGEAYKNLFYFTYREFDSPILYKSQRLYNDTCTLI